MEWVDAEKVVFRLRSNILLTRTGEETYDASYDPDWSAYRQSYPDDPQKGVGYGELLIFNRTHATWNFYSSISNDLIDTATVVNDRR